ncbi:MAG: DegT/DnrJ/EryC1/StrS family aminotransferase [Nitrospirae bacterium]|nr:DegT/DnrJ/EryC1/StrS family aminotransferase [Nitrospirota bacterium]
MTASPDAIGCGIPDFNTRRGIMAIHMEECYIKSSAVLPVTERITKNTVLLPIYPSMTEEEQEYVVTSAGEILI